MTCQKTIEDSPIPLSLSVAAAVVALAAAVGFSSLTPNSVAKESKRNLFSVVDMSGLQSMTDLTLLRRADVLLPISLWVRGRCSLSLLLRGRGEEEAGSSFLPSGEVGKWKFPVSAAERVAVAVFGTRYVTERRKGNT